MSLLLLLKPNGTAVVIPPPPPSAAPSLGQGVQNVFPPPAFFRFQAGTATVLFRAVQPDLLLLPTASRARIGISVKPTTYEMRLESPAKKQPKTYRAVRDERADEEFLELIETAYLLTR